MLMWASTTSPSPLPGRLARLVDRHQRRPPRADHPAPRGVAQRLVARGGAGGHLKDVRPGAGRHRHRGGHERHQREAGGEDGWPDKNEAS